MNKLIKMIKSLFFKNKKQIINDTKPTINVALKDMSKKELIDYFESQGVKVDKRFNSESMIKKYKKLVL